MDKKVSIIMDELLHKKLKPKQRFVILVLINI